MRPSFFFFFKKKEKRKNKTKQNTNQEQQKEWVRGSIIILNSRGASGYWADAGLTTEGWYRVAICDDPPELVFIVYSSERRPPRAGDVAQRVEGLPSRTKFEPRCHMKPGAVLQVYNPSIWEVETGD